MDHVTVSLLGTLSDWLDIIGVAFTAFFNRFYWPYWLSAGVMALGCWIWQRRTVPEKANESLGRFLFPRTVWLHRSALLDYRFVLFDKTVLAVLVLAAGALFPHEAAAEAMEDGVGPHIAVIAAYTIALVLVDDFCRYWAHRFMHTMPLLWQFHKVHHSAEVLVPLSQMRNHPVNGIVNLIRSGVALGVVTGIFMLLFPEKMTVLTIFGVNAGRWVFNMMGANLRHSHIWLSFGPVLSHVFISPAQHQIHHSKLARHIDKNFGSQFALWDWMFGSLYIPRGREELVLGISKAETERLRTVKDLYIQPIRDAAAMVRDWRNGPSRTAA